MPPADDGARARCRSSAPAARVVPGYGADGAPGATVVPELPCVSVFVVGGAPGPAEGSPDRRDEVVATPGSVPDPTGTAGVGALAPHAARPITTPITMVRWMRKTNDPSPRTGATVRFVTQLPAGRHVQTEPCAAPSYRRSALPRPAAPTGFAFGTFAYPVDANRGVKPDQIFYVDAVMVDDLPTSPRPSLLCRRGRPWPPPTRAGGCAP